MLDALIDELARVYWEDGRAQVLVLRAGFPSEDLPRFTTPRVFWSLVTWGTAGGEIADGMEVLEAIVGGAIEEYPGNEVFRGWERKPEGWELGSRRGVLARVRREIIDFELERGRHTCFFGREDVLAEMDAWVAERDSGWLLVTGSPGLGKSALMSHRSPRCSVTRPTSRSAMPSTIGSSPATRMTQMPSRRVSTAVSA